MRTKHIWWIGCAAWLVWGTAVAQQPTGEQEQAVPTQQTSPATQAAAAEPAATGTTRQWTLQECLDYALENNIQLRQNRNDYLSGVEDTKEARAALLPSLTASTTQAYTNYPSSNVSDNDSYTGPTASTPIWCSIRAGCSARRSAGSSCRTASTR